MKTAFPICLLLLSCVAGPTLAQDDTQKIGPRVEGSLKGGTDRSLVMTGAWVPVAQDSEQVAFADIRFSADDAEGREGNLGLGYRKYIPDPNIVVGGYGYYDRRHTEAGNNFDQATLGVDAYGEHLEARVNAYIALDNGKTFRSGGAYSDPYVLGSSIVADSAELTREEPQSGFDAELGYRLPFFEESADSWRVYAGGYSFYGDDTPDVNGWRVRTKYDITPNFSVGACFQDDDVRGTQGFLTATYRLGDVPSFKARGVWARLAESPERDVDIVTGSKIVQESGTFALTNAQGQAQRILVVDNTATGSNEGTIENPYNNLLDAENAQQAGDIIYVRAGDGTSTNYDTGFYIYEDNVQLAGSGSALRLAGLTARDGRSFSGYTLFDAGTNPLVTFASGDAVLIEADNVTVQGLQIDQADESGIYVDGVTAAVNNVTLRDLLITNSGLGGLTGSGITIESGAGSNINATLDNVTASNSFQNGVEIINSGGAINDVTITDSSFTGNGNDGLDAQLGAYAGNFTVSGTEFTGNGDQGVSLQNDGGATPVYNFNGNNSFNTNVTSDVALDIDSATFNAQESWWGQAGGPVVGQIVDVGTATIDTSDPLATAP
jgi:hypothetical protein